jgi:hypothetical protein
MKIFKRIPAGYRFLRVGETVKAGDLYRSKFPDWQGYVWRPAWGAGTTVKAGGIRYARLKPTKI